MSCLFENLTLHIQEGHSAFHAACQEGHDEAVKILMRAKADLHLKTKVIVKLVTGTQDMCCST